VNKIKLIHIGLGAWGSNWAAHVLPGHPDIETVAYVDMVADKRERMALRIGEPSAKFFERFDLAVAATAADAVSIAVPIALHEPLTRHALEAGKHVVVEKPFAATMAEAKGLVALAHEKNRILAVSQNYRYYPASRMAAELVHTGYFGKVIGGKVDFRRNAIAERSGNINVPNPLVSDMAVHHYDLMRMVIGEDPVEISARSWNPPGSP
jgi:predicted dehydrogenase